MDTNYDPEREEEAIKTLLGKQVDGMIIVLGRDNAEYLSMLDDWNIPVVFLDKKAEGKKNADAVLVNNKESSKRLIEHVLSLGYRRIGIIAGPLDTTTGRERLEGYLEALSDFSLPRDETLIKVGDFRKESGYKLALELLNLSPLPEVIYACNNLMGLGAMEAIKEKGFHIPEEVGLVIFDD
ncbi:MAG: substrate-binding domain-containing protein, partial [Candidatus Methanomethyliaceae archaeon]